MMSTVSLDKKGTPLWRMFCFTLKTNKPIIIMGSIIALLALPIFPITAVFNPLVENDFVESSITIGLVIEILISFLMIAILTITNFGFLHNKSSSDMYYALPITRKDLYLSRLLATATGSAIPSVVSLLAGCVCLPIINENISFNITVFRLLEYTLFFIIMVAAISIIASMFMLFTGQTFDALVSFFGINIGLPILALAISGYFSSKLYGATSEIFDIVTVLNFTPIGKAVYFMIYRISILDAAANSSSEGVDIGVIFWLIIAVLALFLCLSFSKKRRSEKAGEGYAHPLLPIILQLLISALVAFGMGEIFSMLSSFSVIYFIFAIIGALLASVLLGAIINRGFKKIKKDLIIGGCSAVLVFAFGLSILGGFFGFENRVPKLNNVKSVVFTIDRGFSELSGSLYTEEKEIGAVIDFHNAVIEKTKPKGFDLLSGKPNNYPYVNYIYDGDEQVETGAHCSFKVAYTLKNGRVVEREYGGYFEHHCKKQLRAMLDTENYMNMYTIYEDSEGLHPTTIYYYNDDYNNTEAGVSLTLEMAKQILKAYREDIIVGVEQGSEFELNVSGIDIDDETSKHSGSWTEYYGYNGMTLQLNSSFKNTIKVMMDYGFKLK